MGSPCDDRAAVPMDRGHIERSMDLLFEAELYELPSNYPHILNVALDVPSEVSDAFGVRGYVPVVGTVDGCPLTATLVPKGNGGHRLFLNAEVRTTIGKRPGQKVRLALRFDPAERMPDVPEDLQSSLRGAKAIDAWAALPPSRRRELLVYIADAKRQDTRKRRIRRVVDRLVPGAD